MSIQEQAQRRLSQLAVRLLSEDPFYATLWLHCQPRLSDKGPTAWATENRVYFNPEFLMQQTIPQALGLAKHELLHIIFGHVPRMKQYDGRKYNYCADAIINHMLVRQQRYELPEGGVMLPVEEVDGVTVEELYRKIKNPPEDFETDLEAGGESASDGQSVPREVKEALAAAVAVAKQSGKMPVGLERLIGVTLNEQKGKYARLREAMIPVLSGNDDFAWRRPNHAWRRLGFYLPSLCSKLGVRRVVIGVDTSGSISAEELNEFVGECRSIIADLGVAEAHIAYCDARLHDVHIVTDGEHYVPERVGGGGGTAFAPVFEYAASVDADAVVYLTDMYGVFPDDPGIPTVWSATSGVVAPWGTTVALRD